MSESEWPEGAPGVQYPKPPTLVVESAPSAFVPETGQLDRPGLVVGLEDQGEFVSALTRVLSPGALSYFTDKAEFSETVEACKRIEERARIDFRTIYDSLFRCPDGVALECLAYLHESTAFFTSAEAPSELIAFSHKYPWPGQADYRVAKRILRQALISAEEREKAWKLRDKVSEEYERFDDANKPHPNQPWNHTTTLLEAARKRNQPLTDENTLRRVELEMEFLRQKHLDDPTKWAAYLDDVKVHLRKVWENRLKYKEEPKRLRERAAELEAQQQIADTISPETLQSQLLSSFLHQVATAEAAAYPSDATEMITT